MRMRPLPATWLALTLLLAACGGGGDDAGSPAASVSSAGAATPMYGQPLLFTVQGSHLDTGVALSSAGCRDVVRLAEAPYASGPATAYFRCTVIGVGGQLATVRRSSDDTVLATVAYSVPLPQVTLAVSNGAAVAGSLVLTLGPQQAPITVDNFLAYVHAGFYDGTVFHRLASNFVLQGGGFAAGLDPALAVPDPKPTNAPIALEVGRGLSNVRHSVAMARTSAANSATSQFFINLANNTSLDTNGGGYAVFGSVTAGIDFVTAMAAAPCQPYPALLGSGECLPMPNLVITSARQTR